jgi:hypothetical protein
MDVVTTLALTDRNFSVHPAIALGHNLLESLTSVSAAALTVTITPDVASGISDARVIQSNM